jgi:hypothetical protein
MTGFFLKAFQIRRHSLAFSSVPKFLRVLVGEGFDHFDILMGIVNNVERYEFGCSGAVRFRPQCDAR